MHRRNNWKEGWMDEWMDRQINSASLWVAQIWMILFFPPYLSISFFFTAFSFFLYLKKTPFFEFNFPI